MASWPVNRVNEWIEFLLEEERAKNELFTETLETAVKVYMAPWEALFKGLSGRG